MLIHEKKSTTVHMIHVVMLLKKMLSEDWAFYNLLVCLIPWFICQCIHTLGFRLNLFVILVLCIKHFGNTLLRNETFFILLCDNFVQEAVLYMLLLVFVGTVLPAWMFVCLHLHARYAQKRPEDGIRSPGTEVPENCNLPRRFWELNWDPLKRS